MTWTPTNWSGRGFTDPDTDPHRKTQQLLRDSTYEAIQRFDPIFLGRWLDGDESVQRGVDDALWIAAVRRAQSPAQRVVLASRVVEHTLGHLRAGKDDNWLGAARRFLRATMVNNLLVGELQDALFCATNAAERTPSARPVLYDRLMKVINDGYTSTELTETLVRELPNLIGMLQVGSIEHRIIRATIDLLQNPDVALARLEVLGRRVDRLLDRTSRQRNSVIHGTGTVGSMLQTVESFALKMAEYAAGEPLRRANDGLTPLTEFEEDRVMAVNRTANLTAGQSPVDALWRYVPRP
jgi:hypothetical protein